MLLRMLIALILKIINIELNARTFQCAKISDNFQRNISTQLL